MKKPMRKPDKLFKKPFQPAKHEFRVKPIMIAGKVITLNIFLFVISVYAEIINNKINNK